VHGIAEYLEGIYFGSEQGNGTAKETNKETGFHDLAIVVIWIQKDGAKVRDNMAASGIWLLICGVKQGAGYCQRFLFVVNWSS
jgi:hypothetical protein